MNLFNKYVYLVPCQIGISALSVAFYIISFAFIGKSRVMPRFVARGKILFVCSTFCIHGRNRHEGFEQ